MLYGDIPCKSIVWQNSLRKRRKRALLFFRKIIHLGCSCRSLISISLRTFLILKFFIGKKYSSFGQNIIGILKDTRSFFRRWFIHSVSPANRSAGTIRRQKACSTNRLSADWHRCWPNFRWSTKSYRHWNNFRSRIRRSRQEGRFEIFILPTFTKNFGLQRTSVLGIFRHVESGTTNLGFDEFIFDSLGRSL